MHATLPQRFDRLPAPSPAADLRLERGALGDYAALAEHHYLAGRPATATRVLTLRHEQPTVVGRFLGRAGETQTAAVLVESLPSLNCKLRDLALHGRYGTWLSAPQRARLLNHEVRCISRVVVDPRWRGLGLAVRLVRAALESATTPVTEALAAMGHVHPFFEKAGMTPYTRPPHVYDARLTAALGVVGLQPHDLALLGHAERKIAALNPTRRAWLGRELRRWWRTRAGRFGKTEPTADVKEQLHTARRRLLRTPVYYLHVNRAS